MRWVALCAALALMGCGSAAAPKPAATTPARKAKPAPHKDIVVPGPKPRIAPLPAPVRRFDLSAPHRDAVPILMYHVVSTPPPGTPFSELWVPWSHFKAQMDALAARGYHGVTLADVFDHWKKGLVLPPKPVVVSFDDGYLSQWQHAARTLRRLGWPGVLNLVVNNIGPGGISDRMVKELIGAGWEIDAHTISHKDLTTLRGKALRHEVAGSRDALRGEFGVPVDFFCYPSGRFDAAVEAAVKAAGYRGATTVAPGIAAPGQDRFALPRIRVNGTDGTGSVVARVAGRA